MLLYATDDKHSKHLTYDREVEVPVTVTTTHTSTARKTNQQQSIRVIMTDSCDTICVVTLI